MKNKEYYEILVGYGEFFANWFKDQYIPKDKEPVLHAIWNAYNKIEPNAKAPFGCQGCVIDMIKMANIQRVGYLKLMDSQKVEPIIEPIAEVKPEYKTFPKHKKKRK